MPSNELAQVAPTGSSAQTWSFMLQAMSDRFALSGGAPEVGSAQIFRTLSTYRELAEARNAFVHGGTASALLVPPNKVSETIIDALVQTQDAYAGRQRAQGDHSDAVENHQSKYLSEWQQRVKSHSERSHEDMLSSLWESGLSWRDIARLLKVSIAAVQKWRSGEKMAPKNFARLRDFVAAYDTVAAHKPGVDVASWLDVPILTDVPVTPRNLWTDGDPSTFFEYALGDLKPEAALDAFDATWRQWCREDGFESFVGEDGVLGIRTKNR